MKTLPPPTGGEGKKTNLNVQPCRQCWSFCRGFSVGWQKCRKVQGFRLPATTRETCQVFTNPSESSEVVDIPISAVIGLSRGGKCIVYILEPLKILGYV